MSQQGLPIRLNPAVVYRGLPMACLNLGGTTAVQFGATGFCQKILRGGGESSPFTQMTGSFLGGVISGIPCSLWELCMIQQQRFGGSILGTPTRIVQQHGVQTLAR